MTKFLTLCGSALYSKLNASTVDINTYIQKAPQNSVLPYAVVEFITPSDDYEFNSAGGVVDFYLKVISDRTMPLEAITLYETLHGDLQDATFSLGASYDLLSIRRESELLFEDSAERWIVGGLYSLDMWEK